MLNGKNTLLIGALLIAALVCSTYFYHPAIYATLNQTSFNDAEMSTASTRTVDPFEQPQVQAKDIADFRRMVFNRPASQADKIPLWIYEFYYGLLGPQQMVAIMEATGYCHEQAHNLGRVIYEMNGDDLTKSLEIAGQSCADGTFHGVLMGAFHALQKGDSDYFDAGEVAKFATTFCDSAEVKKQDISKGACIHGVGHALAYFANDDLQKALPLCNVFSDEGSRYYCATGEYMQRAIDMNHQDASTSLAYPCGSFDYPAACYRYTLWRRFPDWSSASVFCEDLPPGANRNGCFHGLGFSFAETIVGHPSTLAMMCDSTSNIDEKMCTEGTFGILSVTMGTKSARQLCDQQSEPWRDWCIDAVGVSNFGMNRDFTYYYVRLPQE